MKEKVIQIYRKSSKENTRLKTEKLNLSGPSKPLFISESLTLKKNKTFLGMNLHIVGCQMEKYC